MFCRPGRLPREGHGAMQIHRGPSFGGGQGRSVGALHCPDQWLGFYSPVDLGVSDSVNYLYTKHILQRDVAKALMLSFICLSRTQTQGLINITSILIALVFVTSRLSCRQSLNIIPTNLITDQVLNQLGSKCVVAVLCNATLRFYMCFNGASRLFNNSNIPFIRQC